MVEPRDLHRRLVSRAEATSRAAARRWSSLRSVGDWRTVLPGVTGLAAAGRVSAARSSGHAAGLLLGSDAAVVSTAWGTSASDGRPLVSLLYSAVVRGRSLYGSGLSDAQIVKVSGDWLSVLVRGQVMDAGRSASAVVTAATDGAGWVRYVSPPCCQRCAVLAGKWFRWNEGFARHPGCDCTHSPAKGRVPAGYTPTIADDQIRDLTEAQKIALDEGADRNRVLNAYRRANSSAERLRMATTKELAHGRVRLTPEGIIARAKNRDDVVRMLREHGYLL